MALVKPGLLRRAWPGLMALTLAGTPGWAQAPLGAEFQVNTYTTGSQGTPAAAVGADGSFIVVWRSTGHDLDTAGVFARRYDASGAPIDTLEFLVNAYTTDDQAQPDVMAHADGGFTVIWADASQDGDGFGVFARRFDAGGSGSPEFRVNTYTTGLQAFPAVSADSGGNLVVVWQSYGQDGSSDGIFARLFDAAGTPQGLELQVNTYTTGSQSAPQVARAPAGGFVVAWQGPSLDDGGDDVFARRYDAFGIPAGPEFRVNTGGIGHFEPTVATAGDGAFVVAWTTAAYASASNGIFARLYDANGVPRGAELQVNTYTTAEQVHAAVASDAAGNFVVAWESSSQDGSHYGNFARLFDPLGAPSSAEFRLNRYTTSGQWSPAVSAATGGGFVAVWEGYGQDGDSFGVFGQRLPADLVFRDDLQMNGLHAWSASAVDAGDLTVAAAAGLAGTTLGLAGVVDDTAGLYVEDGTPNNEPRYRARFYFDPNAFDPGEAQDHRRTRIFIAFAEDPTRRVATIVLRRLGGAYSLMARARQEGGIRLETGFFPIADAPHAVELELLAAGDPDSLDGALELWIDGVSQTRLTGLDNSDAEVDFVRMGALSVKTGAAGTLYWDEFESRRASYIGLLP